MRALLCLGLLMVGLPISATLGLSTSRALCVEGLRMMVLCVDLVNGQMFVARVQLPAVGSVIVILRCPMLKSLEAVAASGFIGIGRIDPVVRTSLAIRLTIFPAEMIVMATRLTTDAVCPDGGIRILDEDVVRVTRPHVLFVEIGRRISSLVNLMVADV